MELKEIYQRVRDGLEAQGWKRSIGMSGWGCRYRGTDGRKCAIGHLIDDEDARALDTVTTTVAEDLRVVDGQWSLEHPDSAHVTLDRALTVAGIPATDEVRKLLVELQHAHDTATDDTLRDQILSVGRHLGLEDADAG